MMDLFSDYKFFLLLLAIALGLQNYFHYIAQTLKGEFKPHMFSWGIWSLLSWIVFAAQWNKDAGLGQWQTFIMAIGTGIIAIIAYYKGDKHYAKTDWAALLCSLSAIPIWIVTKDPLWSVVLVTIIDVIACWPTVRKAWVKPHEDSARIFFTCGIITALGFLALSTVTVTTALYPAAITVINFTITGIILLRRNTGRTIRGQ